MLASDKVKNDRLKICDSCEHKRNDFKLFNVTLLKREAQCEICKCMLNKKASLDFAHCPLKKW